MKKFQNMSIKAKLPLLLGASSFAVMAVICLLLMFPLRNESVKSASENAQLTAINSGLQLSETINAAAAITRSFGSILTEIVTSTTIYDEHKRDIILSKMQALVNENLLDNIWVKFEPNALDGMDDRFAGNHPGSNGRGIFCPWVYKGAVVVLTNEVDALYANTRYAGREIISEPYSYTVSGNAIHFISACFPIYIDGKFAGVAGTDFKVADLIEIISGTDNTQGRLVTDKGNIAVYHDMELIGSRAEDGNREILNRFSEKRMFDGIYEYGGEDVYKVYVPVQIGQNAAPWFFGMDVPLSVFYEQARRTETTLILYCLLGVALISLACYLLIQSFLKGVISVTGIINRLSLGHIARTQGEQHSLDEVGHMKTELGNLVEGLHHTAQFAKEIGKGNLNAEFTPLSDDDTLGNALLEMRQNLTDAKREGDVLRAEEINRNWASEGLAKFADILRRNNDNMELFSYNIISNMVKYLNANQGSIFILNDENGEQALELKACYAFERKKYAQKQILPGEGLVGSCFLERETIYMTELPDDYITITSGLGCRTPRELLIAPLKINEKIYGVVEIASFDKFEPHHRSFVENLCESIASTVSSMKVNIQTNRLLEQTKLQAEEMANQEEELRQNMEEMQATQEESRRREAEMQEALSKMKEMQARSEEKEYEMQQFYNSIYETNYVVEFSANATITGINRNLLDLFDNSIEAQYVGKPLAYMVGEEAYTAAWANLTSGKIYEGTQYVPTGENKTVLFHQKYIPVCDRQGNLLRAILLVYPEAASSSQQPDTA